MLCDKRMIDLANQDQGVSFFLVSFFWTQMWRGKALGRAGLVLLSLWLCIQAVPIAVDKTKVNPPEEKLESPQSAVSRGTATICF